MPRDEWSSDNWNDDESDWHDDDDFGPEDQATTTECTKCGCEIYDDAVICPLCGEYQSRDRLGTAWEGRPWWWKVGGLVGILAVLLGMLVWCF